MLENIKLSVKEVITICTGLVFAIGIITTMQVQLGRQDEQIKGLQSTIRNLSLRDADMTVRIDAIVQSNNETVGEIATVSERQRVMNELTQQVLNGIETVNRRLE